MADIPVIISRTVTRARDASPSVPTVSDGVLPPVNPSGSNSGGARTFIELGDTLDESYVGKAGFVPIVNSDEEGLELVELGLPSLGNITGPTVLGRQSGTGEIQQLTASQVSTQIVHNSTSDKDGGDGTKWYHLGQDDYDDLQSILNPVIGGSEWILRSTPVSRTWLGITYANNQFVAIANEALSGDDNVMTSPDGINWTIQTAFLGAWSGIVYANGVYVVVGGQTNYVMTSPDAVTWTLRTPASTLSWRAVTFGNGLFVAVAASGTDNRVMTSPDGITWTSRTAPNILVYEDVIFAGGLFVAVASSGTDNRVMTSPDGITWTSRVSAANNAWRSITYGNGLFVAVASSGTGNRVMTSPDGINWTIRNSALDLDWYGVTFGNGVFVAVAENGTGNRVMSSTDGINWSIETTPADNGWRSITFGLNKFIALSFNGHPNQVMTSEGSNIILNHSQLNLDDGRNPHQTRYEDLLGTPPSSDRNIDGGASATIYLTTQKIDGGNA
jgi:hypothetical protein